jgi:SAM-dependent methyltransferase
MRKRCGSLALLVVLVVIRPSAQPAFTVRQISWDDLVPQLQKLLIGRGIDSAAFPAYLVGERKRNQDRLREGDLDHLIYYALQASSFTSLPPIEPALSAKGFVEGLPADERAQFLAGNDDVPGNAIPRAVQARLDDLLKAFDRGGGNARLTDFRDIVVRESAGRPANEFLRRQYRRAMRFLYLKEFGSTRASGRPDVSGELYQQRALSTDTSVEAGYVVYLALATLQRLEPQRRVRRVLIVGPGLDIAPRTSFVETDAPQSYQPFAVMDALLGLSLSERGALRISAVDINPRVVQWLQGVRGTRPRLSLATGVAETAAVRFSDDYRAYFTGLGRTIGTSPSQPARASGRLAKSLDLSAGVTDAVDASTLDIVSERLEERYDLIVITNVFPYLSDPDLLLALGNIARMLAPAGVLIHNEPRPLIGEACFALGLPLVHSRSAVIATVEGGKPPLYDAVWMHSRPE